MYHPLRHPLLYIISFRLSTFLHEKIDKYLPFFDYFLQKKIDKSHLLGGALFSKVRTGSTLQVHITSPNQHVRSTVEGFTDDESLFPRREKRICECVWFYHAIASVCCSKDIPKHRTLHSAHFSLVPSCWLSKPSGVPSQTLRSRGPLRNPAIGTWPRSDRRRAGCCSRSWPMPLPSLLLLPQERRWSMRTTKTHTRARTYQMRDVPGNAS